MKKLIFVLLTVVLGILSGSVMAQEYTLFYADACPHCQEVEHFIKEYDVTGEFALDMREIRTNKNNLALFTKYLDELQLDPNQVFVPFLVVENGEKCNYIDGANAIKSFFQGKLHHDTTCNEDEICEDHSQCNAGVLINNNVQSLTQRLSFLGIMLPAALADSINPCAFAVMLLLLSGILSREHSRKKAIWAGILFAVAVFISYFVMGLGLFSALANSSNTFVLKIIVGSLGVLVGLANLKDFFWYGKGFVMEVPFSWRPKMKKLIDKIVSPPGAFVIGLLVSLFLLPCTSGPYFTILGYLASESSSLNLWGIIYLLIYNLIFILPMLVIVFLVGSGWKSAEELAVLKNKNKKLIHLIVALLMLGLGIYVFGDVFMWWFRLFG